MMYFILLIAGNILASTSGFTLNCTNDLDTLMSCYTDDHNCTRLSLRMRHHHPEDTRTGRCEFDACVQGCCCFTKLEFLVFRDEFIANVYKDGESVHSQTIKVDDTIKPPAPSITSVEPLNGIYRVQWRTNAKQSIREDLMAVVTYQKKGANKKTSEHREPSRGEVDKSYYEIHSRNLEPNTEYVVSVKTYTHFGEFSDNSNEVEFTTSTFTNGELIALILCPISVAAIIISGAAFALSVKLKGKWWDKAVKVERPKILDIKPTKEAILTPESLSVYSLSVEPLVSKYSRTSSKDDSLSEGRSGQTSGISTASSSLDYADAQPQELFDMEALLREALRNDFPIFTPAFSSEEPIRRIASPPPLEKTPSPVFYDNNSYISSDQTNVTDEVDLQLTCDTGNQLSEGPMLHHLIISPHDSVTMETDMSYQSCGASGGASSDSESLPVNCGYQGFEKLIEQSNSRSSAEKTDNCQSLVQGGDDHIPHVSNQIIVDPGYHCV